MRTRTLALTGLLLALAGCDTQDNPSIGGTYSGTSPVSGFTVAYTIDLPETSGGTFAWTGEVEIPGSPTTDIGGTGNYDHPDVSFTETVSDEPSTIDGTVSDDGDTITLTDDFNGEEITLVLRRD